MQNTLPTCPGLGLPSKPAPLLKRDVCDIGFLLGVVSKSREEVENRKDHVKNLPAGTGYPEGCTCPSLTARAGV